MHISTLKTQLPLQKDFRQRKPFEEGSSQALSSEMILSHSNRSFCPKKSSLDKVLSKSSRMSTMSQFSGASTQGSLTNEPSIVNIAGYRSGGSQVRVSLSCLQDSHHIFQRISQISHPHILPIHNLQISHNHVTFTTVPIKMSLLDLIKGYKEAEESISKETLFRYCYELIDGFQFLNEIFPDIDYLEPRSILIDQNDHIRIASFGDLKFAYDKSAPSLMLSNNKLEFSQVSSVLAATSKRGCKGDNLGPIIAGLCTLKSSLISNIKLYGDNRKKIIKGKLKNLHLFYGKSFIKLLHNLFDPDILQNDAMNHFKYALSLTFLSSDLSDNHKKPSDEKHEDQIITEVSDSESQISPSPKYSKNEFSKPKATFPTSALDNVPLFESCIVSFPPSTIPHKPQEKTDLFSSPQNEEQKSLIKGQPIIQKPFSESSVENKEEEKPFTNEISKISAESIQDLNEERLELKNLFQQGENIAEEVLANHTSTIFMEKRTELSNTSPDQLEVILKFFSKMLRINHISFSELQKYQDLKCLNPQNMAEKSKESPENFSVLLKELNISPWFNSSESREEKGQEIDQARILSKQKGSNTIESSQRSPLKAPPFFKSNSE